MKWVSCEETPMSGTGQYIGKRQGLYTTLSYTSAFGYWAYALTPETAQKIHEDDLNEYLWLDESGT